MLFFQMYMVFSYQDNSLFCCFSFDKLYLIDILVITLYPFLIYLLFSHAGALQSVDARLSWVMIRRKMNFTCFYNLRLKRLCVDCNPFWLFRMINGTLFKFTDVRIFHPICFLYFQIFGCLTSYWIKFC